MVSFFKHQVHLHHIHWREGISSHLGLHWRQHNESDCDDSYLGEKMSDILSRKILELRDSDLCKHNVRGRAVDDDSSFLTQRYAKCGLGALLRGLLHRVYWSLLFHWWNQTKPDISLPRSFHFSHNQPNYLKPIDIFASTSHFPYSPQWKLSKTLKGRVQTW